MSGVAPAWTGCLERLDYRLLHGSTGTAASALLDQRQGRILDAVTLAAKAALLDEESQGKDRDGSWILGMH